MIAIAFDIPWALAAMAAALPVVALFLLKRKRRNVAVSSSMLWRRALKETMARTPFRKPSEWLSLLLMLIALIAGVLGAAGLRLGSGGGGRALVLVIDVSASMATEQREVARIDVARGKAAEAMDALKSGDEVTLIAAGARPQVLVHATADIAAARLVLAEVDTQAVGCDMRAAMSLALAEGRDGAEIVVLSDFCHGPDAWADLAESGARVTLVQCGEKAPNVGITHAAVSADEGGVSLLARVAGEGARTLSLYVGDALVDAREVICAGQEVAVVFGVPQISDQAGAFQRATLKLEPADELELDDVAHVAIGRTEPPRILHIGMPDPFIKRLEAAVPGLVVDNMPANAGDLPRRYDLAIVTEQVTVAPAARCELYIGCTPPQTEITSSGEIVQPELADWDSTHPLLRGVGLENLLFAKAQRIEAPRQAVSLVKLREGPLLLELRQDGREIYTWACGINDSNLVLRPAFPVFVRNLLGEAVHRVQGRTSACGEDLTFSAPATESGAEHEFRITSPGGQTRTAQLLTGELYAQRAPLKLGFYEVELDAAPGTQVGTALYNSAETTLQPDQPRPPAEADIEVVTAGGWTLERPVWQWCAVIATIALLFELGLWLSKNRRPA
jgi:Ca-activated chloride channel homolog